MLAEKLKERLGQPIVVDNRGGANGIIGMEIVARAPADGHTLLVNTPSYTINGGVRKLPYDSIHDFAPVGLIAVTPLIENLYRLKDGLAAVAQAGQPGALKILLRP